MSNEAKREFIDLEVHELSVVDSPANEEEFIVIKCRQQQEGTNMADKQVEKVTKDAGEAAAKVELAPENNDAKVEKVAVEVEKAKNDAVVEAMAKVQTTVEDIAKQLNAKSAAGETPTPREVVEKQLKAAGFDEKAIQKSLSEYDAAVPKVEATAERPEALAPVEKSINEDATLETLTQLEAAIAKAKRFTPQREETLKNIVIQLQKFLAALQPQTPNSVTTPKNTLPSNASAGEADLTAVTKALGGLSETIQKFMGMLQGGQKDLTNRVENIEKARLPSKAVNEDNTDGAEKVSTEKTKNLWGGIL